MKELEQFRLLLASPTYGYVDPHHSKELRAGIMFAANQGVTWAGDASTDKVPFATARNTSAQCLLDSTEANGMMWVDSDIRQEPSDISRVLLAAKSLGADFVTGIYHQRRPPYNATIFRWKAHLKLWLAISHYPKNSYEKVDACGFGFVYTSKNLIDRIVDSEGEKFNGWFPDEQTTGGFGEDMAFCYKAMNLGVQLYAHTGVIVGHMGEPEVIRPETHEPQSPTVLPVNAGSPYGRKA